MIDSKRKRLGEVSNSEENGLIDMTNGPKNLIEAGPGFQARLQQ